MRGHTKINRVLAATLFSVISAVAFAAPIEIGVGYPSAPDGPHAAGAIGFAKALDELMPGHFKVTQYPNGSLGGEREMVESVQFGNLEMAITSTSLVANFVPELNVFDFPFLFRNAQHARKVIDGPIGQSILAKYADYGLLGLGIGEIGFRHLTNSKRPVNTVDDLKGLKVRTMENNIYIDAFRDMGALPTPMSWTELIPALQQGTVDGQENPLSIMVSSKMWQVQKYLTLSAHTFTPISFTVSPDFFNGLDKDEQEAIRKAVRRGVEANRKYVDEIEETGLKQMEDNGVSVIKTIDRDAFRSRLDDVYKKRGEKYRDLLQQIEDAAP